MQQLRFDRGNWSMTWMQHGKSSSLIESRRCHVVVKSSRGSNGHERYCMSLSFEYTVLQYIPISVMPRKNIMVNFIMSNA